MFSVNDCQLKHFLGLSSQAQMGHFEILSVPYLSTRLQPFQRSHMSSSRSSPFSSVSSPQSIVVLQLYSQILIHTVNSNLHSSWWSRLWLLPFSSSDSPVLVMLPSKPVVSIALLSTQSIYYIRGFNPDGSSVPGLTSRLLPNPSIPLNLILKNSLGKSMNLNKLRILC